MNGREYRPVAWNDSTLDIPDDRVVSIEHPCVIQDIDKGITTLGGESHMKHVFEYRIGGSGLNGKIINVLPEPIAGVSLRPGDPYANRVSSTGIETRDVLIRVTVPKRTGRKRKRGSNDPYTFTGTFPQPKTNVTAPELLQRLREDAGEYSLEAVGMVRDTHRFRVMPDFQQHATKISAMRLLRNEVIAPEFDRLKAFEVDLSPDAPAGSVVPAPPTFMTTDQPYRYEYQQAAGIVVTTDEQGRLTSQNTTALPKRLVHGLLPDEASVPLAPPPNLRARSTYGEQLPDAIRALQRLLDERPLVTKRVALNALPGVSESIFREATQWVGYSFRAGPWRDSLIRYGVDPRTHPRYRVYQTLMFQIDQDGQRPVPTAGEGDASVQPTRSSPSTANPIASPTIHPPSPTTSDQDSILPDLPEDPLAPSASTGDASHPPSHIFDGRTVAANGKTWQICDITDPLVAGLFARAPVRTRCDVWTWGWYHNGTMAKARVILRDKMRWLATGLPPRLADDGDGGDYAIIAALPDRLRRGRMGRAVLSQRTHGARLAALSNEMRNIAKTSDGLRATKSGRGQEGNGEEGDGADEMEEVDEDDDGDAVMGAEDGGEEAENDGEDEEADAVGAAVAEDAEMVGDFAEMDDRLDEREEGEESEADADEEDVADLEVDNGQDAEDEEDESPDEESAEDMDDRESADDAAGDEIDDNANIDSA